MSNLISSSTTTLETKETKSLVMHEKKFFKIIKKDDKFVVLNAHNHSFSVSIPLFWKEASFAMRTEIRNCSVEQLFYITSSSVKSCFELLTVD